MTYTVINNPPPPHNCRPHLAHGEFNEGAIVECNQCGRWWQYNGEAWNSAAPPFDPTPIPAPTDRSWITTEVIEPKRRWWW